MIISDDDPVSTGARRFEVFTGAGKRRNWPDAEKASIVARVGLEMSGSAPWRAGTPWTHPRYTDGAKSLVRRCKDRGVAVPVALEQQDPAFVPAVIAPEVSPDPAPDHGRSPHCRRAEPAPIELEIGGALVRIGSSADADTIAAVITALRASR